MTDVERAARLARAEQRARRVIRNPLAFPSLSAEHVALLLAEYDARADRGASLELEERAHAATSAECARLEAENERLRAERHRLWRCRRALVWLVSLKDGPRDETYEDEKPRAWEEARDAIEAMKEARDA